jgi:hypothetical protein
MNPFLGFVVALLEIKSLRLIEILSWEVGTSSKINGRVNDKMELLMKHSSFRI